MNNNEQNSILIIDDRSDTIKSLINILRTEGFFVSFTKTAENAVALCNKNNFDLLILNISRADNKGIEVCEHLKNNIITKDIPAIFSVSGNNEKSVVKGIATGCIDYFTEPYRPQEVLMRVKTQIDLKTERKRNLSLLSSILPLKAIKKLKAGEKVEADTYENIAILFTDLNNFTKRSSNIPPNLLIEELNDIFTHFDEITEKNHCERIKTIGDAYMAVSSLCNTDNVHNNVLSITKSAIEMMYYLQNRKSIIGEHWEMRAGIHYGKVIGGIVGVKKYMYDIFGKTVNKAARMEQYSDTNKINVSEEVKKVLEKDFDFEKRKIQEVKGLGKTQMYYLKY